MTLSVKNSSKIFDGSPIVKFVESYFWLDLINNIFINNNICSQFCTCFINYICTIFIFSVQ